mgnify:CR=1 FL=1
MYGPSKRTNLEFSGYCPHGSHCIVDKDFKHRYIAISVEIPINCDDVFLHKSCHFIFLIPLLAIMYRREIYTRKMRAVCGFLLFDLHFLFLLLKPFRFNCQYFLDLKSWFRLLHTDGKMSAIKISLTQNPHLLASISRIGISVACF